MNGKKRHSNGERLANLEGKMTVLLSLNVFETAMILFIAALKR
jgi:hypothetical protein